MGVTRELPLKFPALIRQPTTGPNTVTRFSGMCVCVYILKDMYI